MQEPIWHVDSQVTDPSIDRGQLLDCRRGLLIPLFIGLCTMAACAPQSGYSGQYKPQSSTSAESTAQSTETQSTSDERDQFTSSEDTEAITVHASEDSSVPDAEVSGAFGSNIGTIVVDEAAAIGQDVLGGFFQMSYLDFFALTPPILLEVSNAVEVVGPVTMRLPAMLVIELDDSNTIQLADNVGVLGNYLDLATREYYLESFNSADRARKSPDGQSFEVTLPGPGSYQVFQVTGTFPIKREVTSLKPQHK